MGIYPLLKVDYRLGGTDRTLTVDGSPHATKLNVNAPLERAKSQIDLCAWIDGYTGKDQCYF
jgi:hypothetical protein